MDIGKSLQEILHLVLQQELHLLSLFTRWIMLELALQATPSPQRKVERGNSMA